MDHDSGERHTVVLKGYGLTSIDQSLISVLGMLVLCSRVLITYRHGVTDVDPNPPLRKLIKTVGCVF